MAARRGPRRRRGPHLAADSQFVPRAVDKGGRARTLVGRRTGQEEPDMALIPCTCIYGPAARAEQGEATSSLIALARDPWCPAASVHNRLVDQPATGMGFGDVEALD